MKELKSVRKSDNSSITVNYKSYDSTGIWVLRHKKFSDEMAANKFIREIQMDFTKRLMDVEKRTITYEKFTI